VLKSIYANEYKLMVRLLREAREGRGMTQEQVAQSLGITASMLSKWELGQRRIDLRELSLYVQACGIDLVEFVKSWQDAQDALQDFALKKGRPVQKGNRM
jgi:transcriptional regulator with XRE-family HTH domain